MIPVPWGNYVGDTLKKMNPSFYHLWALREMAWNNAYDACQSEGSMSLVHC